MLHCNVQNFPHYTESDSDSHPNCQVQECKSGSESESSSVNDVNMSLDCEAVSHKALQMG